MKLVPLTRISYPDLRFFITSQLNMRSYFLLCRAEDAASRESIRTHTAGYDRIATRPNISGVLRYNSTGRIRISCSLGCVGAATIVRRYCAPLLCAARPMLQRSLAETFTLAPHLVTFNVQSSDSFSRVAAAAAAAAN